MSTWEEFQKLFLSHFLSEDYEDELAEQVCIRVQGEAEPIWDFAFYRVLCRKRNADITEQEMVKLILKNMVPGLASQLREHMQDVDDLVRLETQFEKDWKHHLKTLFPHAGIPTTLLGLNRPSRLEKPAITVVTAPPSYIGEQKQT